MRPATPAIVATAVVLACRGESHREPIGVFAAASLTEAFAEISAAYERQDDRHAIQLNFAGSQQLVLQLTQGADADVFASADVRWMDRVRSLLAGAPVVFAHNLLVVIVPAANPGDITSLADLARPGQRIVLAAEAVPVGAYSREALRRVGAAPGFPPDYASRVLANLASEEDDVKAVAAKVSLGEADAGIVYASDVTTALAPKVHVIEFPGAANVIATYPIAVMAAGDTSAGGAFVAFVTSTEGRAILERRGFRPP